MTHIKSFILLFDLQKISVKMILFANGAEATNLKVAVRLCNSPDMPYFDTVNSIHVNISF